MSVKIESLEPRVETPDERDARALANGAPKIEDVLSATQLEQLAAIAVDAPPSTEYGAIDNAFNVVSGMLNAKPGAPCWFVSGSLHADDENAPVVVSAFTGNGSKSEAAARLYAVARDAVLTLVLHARAKQRELDSLREALATIHAVHSPSSGEEGGAD